MVIMEKIINIGKDIEKLDPSYTAGGHLNCTTTWENTALPFDPTIQLLDI